MSPEAKKYGASAVMHLGHVILTSYEEKLASAMDKRDFKQVGLLAEFLGDENFLKRLEEAAIKYNENFVQALTEIGIDPDLDIPFPFDVVEVNSVPTKEVSLLPTTKIETVTTPDKELSLSMHVLYALITPDEGNESGFYLDRSEIPDAILPEDLKDNSKAKKQVVNTLFAVVKQTSDRLDEYANENPKANMANFVKAARFGTEDTRTFWATVASIYGEYSPADFINIVLKREKSNKQ